MVKLVVAVKGGAAMLWQMFSFIVLSSQLLFLFSLLSCKRGWISNKSDTAVIQPSVLAACSYLDLNFTHMQWKGIPETVTLTHTMTDSHSFAASGSLTESKEASAAAQSPFYNTCPHFRLMLMLNATTFHNMSHPHRNRLRFKETVYEVDLR